MLESRRPLIHQEKEVAMKRLGLIGLLVGCVMIVIGVLQCGGDTSTTTGPVTSADGGNNNNTNTTTTTGPTGGGW
jgi:hypothetical protein